jgi:hypothetical protein
MLKQLQKRVNVTIVSALVVLTASGVWILNRGFVAQSAAVFALIGFLPMLIKGIRKPVSARFGQLPPKVKDGILRYWPYLVVIIGTLISLGPVALGEMPVSQDHANHYFATHILVREMIPSGRFFGWTDSLGTGYPFGDTYHTPAYLITGLLYLVSLGFIALSTSYAFGIVLAWIVPVIAVTAWTRRIAGPVAAIIAGLAFALDMGSDREGGWVYAMFHGVWTQHVGAGVWMLALLALFRLVEIPTTRRLATAVLTAGVTMWIHPMNSVTLLIGGLLLFAIQYFANAKTESEIEKQKAVLLVFALFGAGVIGLVWVIRMITAGDVVFAHVAYWQPLQKIMTHLLEGELMDNQLALVSVLGLIGFIQLAVVGGRFRIFTLVLPAVCILIGSMVLILESDMGLAGGSLGIMQYRRFSVAAKPFWYAMSGVGVTTIAAALKGYCAERRPLSRPAWVLVAGILAPFLSAGLSAFPGLFRSPVAMPLTADRTGDAANLNAIRNALEKAAERCPESGCRAVYFEKPGHGGLYPVISMADTGFAWQPTLTLPANNFKWINNTSNIDVMAKRGVSVVISKWTLDHDRLTKIGVFGRHRLYRVSNAKPIRTLMQGSGNAQVLSWRPEKRVIRVSGTNAASALVVVQPPYRKWHAEQSGRALELSRYVDDDKQVLSRIENIGDGELILTYDDTLAENIAFVAGMLLIVLCLAGIVAKPKDIPALLTGPRLCSLFHVAGIGASLLLVAAPIGLLIGGKVAANMAWLSQEPAGTRLREVLHQRNPDDLHFTPSRYCVPAYVRNPKFGCSKRDLLPYLTAAPKRRGKIPSCLSIGVPPNGEIAVTYTLPSGTTHLKGYLHHRSGASVTGFIGDQSIGKATRGGRFFKTSTDPKQEEITLILSADAEAEACIELVALESP